MSDLNGAHRIKWESTTKVKVIPIDPPVPIHVTNADRIRNMTDEELAHLLHDAEEHLFTGNLWSYEQWREWLRKEVLE